MTDPKLDSNITFHVAGNTVEMLRLCPNGDIYVRGILAANDQEVVDGLREWLKATESRYVRVPREPTSEMIQAMEDRHTEGASYIDRNSIQYALWVEVYKAMLAAY